MNSFAHSRFLYYLSLVLLAAHPLFGQQDSTAVNNKPDFFDYIEKEQRAVKQLDKGKTNFNRWEYSKKKHAVVGYFGTIGQAGFSDDRSAYTWHGDLGAIYRGYFIDTKGYQMNVHAWVENTNLFAGSDPKTFAKKLEMFSVVNASDETGSSISLEYFLIENFFFNGFWDVTVGKLEPLFYTTFATYSGWDKLTFFSKTASSNPVPDMDGGFGVFTELNFSKYLSVGAQIHDDNPRNEYFDPANFFNNTTYAYQGFVRFAIPSKKEFYSFHSLVFYGYEASPNRPSGNGWIYVGNQGVTDKLILTMKLSHGTGRVFKYNGAYSIGAVWTNFPDRPGDQFGIALQMNELNQQYEYGFDSYYRFFIKDWITASMNLQGYYTSTNELAWIPGIRAMITY